MITCASGHEPLRKIAPKRDPPPVALVPTQYLSKYSRVLDENHLWKVRISKSQHRTANPNPHRPVNLSQLSTYCGRSTVLSKLGQVVCTRLDLLDGFSHANTNQGRFYPSWKKPH